MNPLVGAASCCLSPFALCDVLFAASRCPSTPSNQRTIKLLRNPRTHSKVCRAAECTPRDSFHSQGSGRSLGSSAAAAAAFVPSAAVQVPEVDSSQPTTQVRLSCSAMPLHNHRKSPPLTCFCSSGCRHARRRQARAPDSQSKLHRWRSSSLLLLLAQVFITALSSSSSSSTRSNTFAVGHLYACVSKFTPGVSFTLSGGVPPKPLTDHSATLASAGLLNAMVRQAKS